MAFSASTFSNVPWELDVIISCVTTGTGGTFLADGQLKVYTASTTVQTMRCSSSAANPNTVASLSTEAAYYWELFGAWSSTTGTSIQAYSVAVLGLN